ncbi:MAG: DUF1223 domain-containing protein [Rubripirellula sp.]
MKYRRRDFLACSSALLVAANLSAEESSPADKGASSKHPTVIELFTSQGCSSCPPADRVLAEYVKLHHQEQLPVLGLSFHVDYWNYLGWSDPFSSPRWSRRQKLYASVLNEKRVYTPQMIVGGRDGLVGSRRKQLDALLADHFSRQPEHEIELQVKLNSSNEIEIAHTVAGESAGKILNVAVIARSLKATASRGENAGRTLTHSNVVRDFAQRRLDAGDGEVRFDLPRDKSDLAVIAYVQDIKAANVSGATEVDV